MSKKKHICIFINVDWFLLSHFTNYLKKIISKDYDVTVITLNTGRCNEIKSLGANVIEIDINRGYSNFISEIRSLKEVYFSIRKLSPDVLELITIKPVIYGGLVARLLKVKKVIFYISGMGAIFTNKTLVGKIRMSIISLVYKFIMKSTSAKVIVENNDDKKIFTSMKVPSESIFLIPGVGVDLEKFFPIKVKSSSYLKVGLASRLLYDKGIIEYIEAAKICKNEIPNADFLLIGDIDPTNPASLTEKEVDDINKEGVVKLLGYQRDMPKILKNLDIFVLPSYREGFPKVIMEASASGLPIVATDVTGCNSAVIDNQTGFLVPAKNTIALSEAILKLLTSSKSREIFAKNARRFAASNFEVNTLSLEHLNVWDEDNL